MAYRARAVGSGVVLWIGAIVGCGDRVTDAEPAGPSPPIEEQRLALGSDADAGAPAPRNEPSAPGLDTATEAPLDDAPLDDAPRDEALDGVSQTGASREEAPPNATPSDAGAPEVPPEDVPSGGDAGTEDGALHPGIEDSAPPPPPLPDDIVERSVLPFHGVADGEAISERGVWRQLQRAQAICLGELHDNPYHHNLQRRVLERLAELQREQPEERGELAVGYEMIQRPFQRALSAFVAGELDVASFLEQTEYEQRWGADLALYRPLFEANRDQGLAALALNAPTELTRAIGREGLESLAPELQALLPELVLDDAEHRAFIFGLFGLSVDDPAAASLENVYRAQVTWDETMALTASEWLTGDAARRVLAFAGTAHCHESAIPRRLARRSGIEMLSVAPVLESELEAFPEDWQGYELLIVLED